MRTRSYKIERIENGILGMEMCISFRKTALASCIREIRSKLLKLLWLREKSFRSEALSMQTRADKIGLR